MTEARAVLAGRALAFVACLTAFFSLGVIVPGMSPSNFLMYFHMYEPMTAGIKNLDLSIIIPLGIGAVLCVLCFAKLMSIILKKAYAGVFHFILGIVLASIYLKIYFLGVPALVGAPAVEPTATPGMGEPTPTPGMGEPTPTARPTAVRPARPTRPARLMPPAV